MTSLALITNIPAPYRLPVYAIVSKKIGYDKFHVIYCAKKEPNRHWNIFIDGFNHTFLKERMRGKNGKFIHNNIDVWDTLNKINPSVVITTGFNPTHIYGFLWAMVYKRKHIPMTDGTFDSEKSLSIFHKLIRVVIYKKSNAFIGSCLGSRALYQSYNVSDSRFFQSHLCANNVDYFNYPSKKRNYDIMFSGRLSPEKNPLFALDVAIGVSKVIGKKVSIVFLGSGLLEPEVKKHASKNTQHIDFTFKGFLEQDALVDIYKRAKIFLFPSSWDPWGVVANEACAAGQAVLVSPHAGVAGELVIDNENGYILPLSLNLWIEKAAVLLNNKEQLDKFSQVSLDLVSNYNYEAAAAGIIDAYNSVETS